MNDGSILNPNQMFSAACDDAHDIVALHDDIATLNRLLTQARIDLAHARAQVACLLVLCALSMLGWWLL